MTNYDYRLWFCNKNISKYFLNQGQFIIIREIRRKKESFRNSK